MRDEDSERGDGFAGYDAWKARSPYDEEPGGPQANRGTCELCAKGPRQLHSVPKELNGDRMAAAIDICIDCILERSDIFRKTPKHEEPCRECDGEGFYDCTVCGGSGSCVECPCLARCPGCHGAKRYVCGHCKGEGKILILEEKDDGTNS